MIRDLADFHIHPDYSIDAEGDIETYSSQAVSLGLSVICFTTHYDSNPRRVIYDGYWRYRGEKVRVSDKIINSYVEDVRNASELFKSRGLTVLCGLEIDYYPGVEREVDRIRSKFDFDFIIGSLHCLDDIAISDSQEVWSYFSRKTVDQMADDYFELLGMAASCSGFDSLGHLDYYSKFGRDFYGNDMDRIEIDRFDPIFEIMKSNNIGFEINTRRFRSDHGAFHPNRSIIRRGIESGVRIASIGSDSHRPEDLASGIEDAYKFIKPEEPYYPRIS